MPSGLGLGSTSWTSTEPPEGWRDTPSRHFNLITWLSLPTPEADLARWTQLQLEAPECQGRGHMSPAIQMTPICVKSYIKTTSQNIRNPLCKQGAMLSAEYAL